MRSRATTSSARVLLWVAVSEACGRALRLRREDSEEEAEGEMLHCTLLPGGTQQDRATHLAGTGHQMNT